MAQSIRMWPPNDIDIDNGGKQDLPTIDIDNITDRVPEVDGERVESVLVVNVTTTTPI